MWCSMMIPDLIAHIPSSFVLAVSDHFHFDREVVSIALNYLDRTVAQYAIAPDGPLPKRQYQLLAVTSLYLAIKLHGEVDTADGVRRKLKIDAFYQLSRNQFEVETIEETERYILTGLKWNVNPPTALRFIAAYLSLCPHWCECSGVLSSIFDVARYLTELSVCQSDFAFNYHTSAIAFASVLCAVEALRSTSPIPGEVLAVLLENISEATGYTYNDPSLITIKSMLKQLCPTMFEAADQAEMEHINSSAYKEDAGSNMSSLGGKNSPVCVVDDSSPTRKRGRN
jgi:Cyclin, N-terminal domain/Cyclin, C-terminal domain